MFFILTLMVPLASNRVLFITVRCLPGRLLVGADLFLLYELALGPYSLFLGAVRMEKLT